jgi:thymidine kinase
MILEYLSSNKFQNTHCIQEPVAEWQHMKSGTDLLESFYSQKERWSFCFENLVQLSRLKAHYEAMRLIQTQPFYQQKEKKARIFLERSIYSSFHVFAENTLDDHGLNHMEYDVLKEYFRFFTSELNSGSGPNEDKSTSSLERLPFKLIYIRSNPAVCFERLCKRNRHSEQLIDLKYLENIHTKYESWITRIHADNLIIIDGNMKKEQVLEQINELFY